MTQFRQNQLTCAWLQGQTGPEEKRLKDGLHSRKYFLDQCATCMIEHVSARGTCERMLTLFCTQLLFNRIQLVPESGYF